MPDCLEIAGHRNDHIPANPSSPQGGVAREWACPIADLMDWNGVDKFDAGWRSWAPVCKNHMMLQGVACTIDLVLSEFDRFVLQGAPACSVHASRSLLSH